MRAFKDFRYIKLENKPLLIVFDAKSLPIEYMNHLNEKAKDNGFNGICFIGISKKESEYDLLRQMGYSFFMPERISNVSTSKNIFIRRL